MKVLSQKIKYDSYDEFITHNKEMEKEGYTYSTVQQNLRTGEITVSYKAS